MATAGTSTPGTFLDLIRDPVRFFRRVSEEGGPAAEIRLGWRRFYVISDPEIIRDMLMTESQRFEKFPQIDPKYSIFGKGLLTSEGAAYKAQRRRLQPSFNRERLAVYAGQMAASTQWKMSGWKDGDILDVGQAMNQLTLDIVAKAMFSIDDFDTAAQIGKHVETMLHMVNQLVMPWGPLLLHSPLPIARRYWKASRGLNALVGRLVEEARAREPADDLVSLLIGMSKPDGTGLSAVEIRDELVTMIVAGHETVANGLTWCLYLLAKHPEVQDQLVRATNDVLGDRVPAADDFAQLSFLEHAFAEALRLYPPIWILGRRALDDYEAGAFRAPKGSVLLVCMANLHRRAEFFPAPDEFQPTRWTNPDWPSYSYIPFGGGTRRCIGERFAWMEGVFCLATMLRSWRFSLTDEREPELRAELALRPKRPMLLRLTALGANARVPLHRSMHGST